MTEPALQPLLHDLMTCVAAPTTVLSAADGQIRPGGAQGVFSADVRVLDRADLTCVGSALDALVQHRIGADGAEFVAVLRGLGDPGPDPNVWLRRRRTVTADGMTETLTVVNASTSIVRSGLELRVSADLAEIEQVKSARPPAPAAPQSTATGIGYATPQVRVDIAWPGAATRREDHGACAQWRIEVPARSEQVLTWSISVTDTGAAVAAAPDPETVLPGLRIEAPDPRLAPLVRTSTDDLRGLLMAAAGATADVFTAAGSPWYLTLFGRDSLWAARMLLPLGTELAGGTLRTLAARQGSRHDPATAEEPGKILHEMRRPVSGLAQTFLPPVYYGTVDATPLWLCLLGEAWRWGLPEAQVAALLPAAERALGWLADSGDPDGDGFLEYLDASGRGLANQGWKDSGDSVRFADGRIAQGTVALAEVQGYAYQAAMTGADLLDAFGRPGGQWWREYAATLAERFRDVFWAADDLGPYPVLALDGAKRPVDAPASNMGHLLGTGMLTPAEAALIGERLVHPSMSSGFGLRTMSDRAGGYSPLSYHCGSVWPHDTAIAVHGLLAEGLTETAGVLIEGLLAAGHAFGGRVPELFGGFAAADVAEPVPYPASCRPQAWSAAAAVVVVSGLLGLAPDVPAGRLRIRPAAAAAGLSVSGIRVAGTDLAVRVSAGGEAELTYQGTLRVER